MREVPKISYHEVVREIPRFEYKTVEKIVEVPVVETVDRVVEVPETRHVVKCVDRVQIVQVPVDRIRHVPKVEVNFLVHTSNILGDSRLYHLPLRAGASSRKSARSAW